QQDYLLISSPPTSATNTHTLSLHDALPILADIEASSARRSNRWSGSDNNGARTWRRGHTRSGTQVPRAQARTESPAPTSPRRYLDRKSTRLNSSHEWISYAVFCLKKKNKDT